MSTTWTSPLGVFDLETTGVDVETARIVSAHVGVLDEHGEPVEEWSWLADPGVEIPEGATAVHGITTEHARRDGRPAADVVAEIVSTLRALFARGVAVTVYNAPYDLTLLNREAVRHGVPPLVAPGPIIDPLVIDKGLDRYRRGKRTLVAAAAHYGVVLDDAHDARSDAVAAGRVAQAIARRHPVELVVDLEVLHRMQTDWCREQATSFQEYMRRARDPHFVAPGEWPERPVPGAAGEPQPAAAPTLVLAAMAVPETGASPAPEPAVPAAPPASVGVHSAPAAEALAPAEAAATAVRIVELELDLGLPPAGSPATAPAAEVRDGGTPVLAPWI